MTPQQRLLAAASQLCADELEVLTLLAERLLLGQRQYGLLRLANDSRDFRREARDELLDGCVYLAAQSVRETGT